MNNIIVLRFYKMSIKIDVPVRSNNLLKIDRSIVASLITLILIQIYKKFHAELFFHLKLNIFYLKYQKYL